MVVTAALLAYLYMHLIHVSLAPSYFTDIVTQTARQITIMTSARQQSMINHAFD